MTAPNAVRELFEGSDEGTSPMHEWPWVHVKVKGIEQPVWVVYGTDEDGRYVLTGLLLSRKQNVEITSRDLRSIPLGQIRMLGDRVLPLPRVRTPAYKPTALNPGPTGWDREHFESVAAAYQRAAAANPGAPVKALAAQFVRSEATVHRWLQRCRDLGLVGPTRIQRAQAKRQLASAREKKVPDSPTASGSAR